MPAPKYSRYYVYIKPVIENKIARSVAPYIFSIATVSILIVFAIRPTISTIINLQKNIENNQQVLLSLKKKAEDLTNAKTNLDMLNPQVKTKISGKIPPKANIASLIKSLQSSSLNHASVSALQIQPLIIIDNTVPEAKDVFVLDEINFSYNIQGNYQGLMAVLQNLRRAERLIKIDNLVLSRGDGPTILSITGKAYFIK